MKTIPIRNSGGLVALVDDEDYERLSQYTWYLRDLRGVKTVRRSVGYGSHERMFHLHREVMRAPDRKPVRHLDGNGLNCQKSNLTFGYEKKPRSAKAPRVKPPARERHPSHFTGVSWNTDAGRWVAHITANGKRYHLGYFEEEDQAAEAYYLAALKLRKIKAVRPFYRDGFAAAVNLSMSDAGSTPPPLDPATADRPY